MGEKGILGQAPRLLPLGSKMDLGQMKFPKERCENLPWTTREEFYDAANSS
jgi:hypothetical protein